MQNVKKLKEIKLHFIDLKDGSTNQYIHSDSFLYVGILSV